jgi:hypothetical protein
MWKSQRKTNNAHDLSFAAQPAKEALRPDVAIETSSFRHGRPSHHSGPIAVTTAREIAPAIEPLTIYRHSPYPASP